MISYDSKKSNKKIQRECIYDFNVEYFEESLKEFLSRRSERVSSAREKRENTERRRRRSSLQDCKQTQSFISSIV